MLPCVRLGAMWASQVPSLVPAPWSEDQHPSSRGAVCRARQKLRPRRSDREGVDSAGGEEEVFSLERGWSEEFREVGALLESGGNALPGGTSPADDASVLPSSSSRGGLRREDRAGGRRDQRAQAQGKGKGTALSARAPRSGQLEEELPRETHRLLKVMAGQLRGKRLLSPADRNVRPMMEMVRGAVFSMVQALAGSPGFLPGGRWLDLYSGTGSVGIEALSRGCTSAHFVEMDPWVVSSVLSPNLAECSLLSRSLIHTARVEGFLERVEKAGAASVGGPFEFVSVTPPYEAVVYADLMAVLARSPLLSESSCVVVEYPQLSKDEVPDACGPLVKIRDRKYGRTNVAIYGPEWASEV